jgi:membrane associated rhomboid family serine protease
MMFLHGGWLHLILNMWTLWLFGSTVEDRLGHGRYLAFYIVCGVAAAVAHVLFNPTSQVPALGASGAIAGVLGCYMRLFPLARVIVVVPIIFIPLFFEILRLRVCGYLVSASGPAGNRRAVHAQHRWWSGVVGSCRWFFVVSFLLGPWLHQPEPRHRAYYPDEGELGFNTAGRL